MRKMQEDNEFRFQELEKRGAGRRRRQQEEPKRRRPPSSDTTAADETRRPATAPSAAVHRRRRHRHAPRPPIRRIPALGAPPTDLGDHHRRQERQRQDGGDRPASPVRPARRLRAMSSGRHARLRHCPRPTIPDELYRNSYQFILSGDYSTAEAGFPRPHRALSRPIQGVGCALLAGRVAARPAEIPRRGRSVPCGQPATIRSPGRRPTCC